VLGINHTFFLLLTGLFCGEFHKGFTLCTVLTTGTDLVNYIPSPTTNWGLTADCPPTAENILVKFPTLGGKPRFPPIVKTIALPLCLIYKYS